MVTFTCNTCYRIYHGLVVNGRMKYIIRNRRVMLLSDEQDCENCIEKIEKSIVQEKKAIREDSINNGN